MYSDKYLIPEWRTPRKKAIRDGVGEGLIELTKSHENLVVVSADLAESVRVSEFAQEYPTRFVEVGVAEQNMIGVASGLSYAGLVPFAVTYATFSPGRTWEQIRVSVALSKANVKIVGSHGGLATGENGPSHQATEDISLMRVLPNMIVLVPADANQAMAMMEASYKHIGPVYIRTTRPNTPNFTKKTPYIIGKSQIYREGKDISICACGIQVYEALMIAEELANENIDIEVINVGSIKPLDEETILTSVKKTGKLITIEDHQIAGGMGSAIAEFLGENYPILIKRIGVNDKFGYSGTYEKVYSKMKLDRASLKKAVVDWFHE